MPDIELTRLQCRHIHTEGRRCGSPALRNENFCYYHGKSRRPGPRQPQVKTLTDRKNSTFDLPSPAELNERAGIQLAIAQILHKIAHNEIDPRRAGLLLYGLQIATSALPAQKTGDEAVDPEELVDELTHDPELGPLAPEVSWEDNRPKSTIERLIESMEGGTPYRRSRDFSEPLSLNAVAANPRPRYCPSGFSGATTARPRTTLAGPTLSSAFRGLCTKTGEVYPGQNCRPVTPRPPSL